MPIERIKVDTDLLQGVKRRIKPGTYIECGKCSALKVDAIELARLLDQYEKSLSPDDDDVDNASDLLSEIIEAPPYIKNWDEWCKWEKDNSNRHCPFLDPDNYGDDMYVKFNEIILTDGKRCDCFHVVFIKR